ncbi:MAG: hypothetical protein ACP5PJ_00120, partial [Acidimicrobiales bacterium]
TVVEVAAVVEVVEVAAVVVVLALWCEGWVVLVVLDDAAVPHAPRTSASTPTRKGSPRNRIPNPPCGLFGT